MDDEIKKATEEQAKAGGERPLRASDPGYESFFTESYYPQMSRGHFNLDAERVLSVRIDMGSREGEMAIRSISEEGVPGHAIGGVCPLPYELLESLPEICQSDEEARREALRAIHSLTGKHMRKGMDLGEEGREIFTEEVVEEIREEIDRRISALERRRKEQGTNPGGS